MPSVPGEQTEHSCFRALEMVNIIVLPDKDGLVGKQVNHSLSQERNTGGGYRNSSCVSEISEDSKQKDKELVPFGSGRRAREMPCSGSVSHGALPDGLLSLLFTGWMFQSFALCLWEMRIHLLSIPAPNQTDEWLCSRACLEQHHSPGLRHKGIVSLPSSFPSPASLPAEPPAHSSTLDQGLHWEHQKERAEPPSAFTPGQGCPRGESHSTWTKTCISHRIKKERYLQ